MSIPRSFSTDPVEQFTRWFDDAKACASIGQANAMCLSTVDPSGYPDGRMVLLKHFDADGFVFYTNLHSAKGRAIGASPRAALTFYWEPLKRQVRIVGDVTPVSDEEADEYWITRPRLAQIGAWASAQSAPLDRLRTFIEHLRSYNLKFAGGRIPRPPHWTGLRVKPLRVEFWRERRGRLHERFQYERAGRTAWTTRRLYP